MNIFDLSEDASETETSGPDRSLSAQAALDEFARTSPTLTRWLACEAPETGVLAIEEMVEKMTEIVGSSRLVGLLTTLGAVTAAGGPRYRAKAMGLEVSSSLHLLFLGTNSLSEEIMLRIPFEPLRSIVQARTLKHSALRERTLEDLERETSEFMRTLETTPVKFPYPPDYSNHDTYDDGTLSGGSWANHEPRGSAPAEPQPSLENLAGDIGRTMHPLALAEPFMPDQYAFYREIAGGMGVYSVDSEGMGMRSLMQVSNPLRVRGLEILRASYDGAPVIQGRTMPPPWITTLTRFPGDRINELFENSEIRESGFLARTLFIDFAPEPYNRVKLQAIREACPAFKELVENCYYKQAIQERVVFPFSEECTEPWEAFLNELENLTAELPAAGPLVQYWPQHAVKIATAIQIAASQEKPEPIPAARLARAIDILRLAGGRSLQSILNASTRTGDDLALDEAIQILVSKIRSKGPIGRRDLLRCYHRKRAEDLSPILSEALRRKLVVEKSGEFIAA